MYDKIYRVLDANLNRTCEGLRVIEDIARFILDDLKSSAALKDFRHNLRSALFSVPHFGEISIVQRNSNDDVGKENVAALSNARKDIYDVYRANINRVQEGTRVLEEFCKMISLEAEGKLSKIRFDIYSFDKEFSQNIILYSIDKKMDFHLYVVTSSEQAKGRDTVTVVKEAIKGGATCIQLREKNIEKQELLKLAGDIREITLDTGVTFIVNDHIDIAMTVNADGVHLGQGDLPLVEARKIMGPGYIIGVSTHNEEQAKVAEKNGATYVNLGPVYPTGTKPHGSPPVGTDFIKEVGSKLKIPFTVMGGINKSNINDVLKAGTGRIAVVSAVIGAEDIAAAARELVSEIDKYFPEKS